MVKPTQEPMSSFSLKLKEGLHDLVRAAVEAAFRKFIPYCGLECPFCGATRNRECPAVPTPDEILEWINEVAVAKP